VVIAMPLMGMMQMVFHKIVGMAAMRNRFMPAAAAMGVFPVVRPARMTRGASRRIRATLCQCVLIDVPLVGTVKMPVVQIINVPFVFNRGVPAA
jgi:hypothetical protein